MAFSMAGLALISLMAVLLLPLRKLAAFLPLAPLVLLLAVAAAAAVAAALVTLIHYLAPSTQWATLEDTLWASMKPKKLLLWLNLKELQSLQLTLDRFLQITTL